MEVAKQVGSCVFETAFDMGLEKSNAIKEPISTVPNLDIASNCPVTGGWVIADDCNSPIRFCSGCSPPPHHNIEVCNTFKGNCDCCL